MATNLTKLNGAWRAYVSAIESAFLGAIGGFDEHRMAKLRELRRAARAAVVAAGGEPEASGSGMKSDKRDRRRARRAAEQGPLRALIEGSTREACGALVERLVCGHDVPAGPPRTTQTPGEVYRHCPVCPKITVDHKAPGVTP